MKKLQMDDLLVQKYHSAKRGYFSWKKAQLYFGKRNCEALIFQPDGYSDDAVYSLTTLRQLLMTENKRYPCFVTDNPDMEKIAPVFTGDSRVLIVDRNISQDMMNYALFADLPKNWYVASLTEPFGRWGDVIAKNGKIGPEKCFAYGVYRVWEYRQEGLPHYEGKDPVIINFLKRAEDLQKMSLSLDAEEEYVRIV